MPKELLTKLIEVGPKRIAEMDASGDHRPGSFDGRGAGAERFNGPPGLEFARSSNDRVAALTANYPTRFKGFARLPMNDPEAATEELERAVTGLSFCGARFRSTMNGHLLDYPTLHVFWPILERAERRGRPIYVHQSAPQQS